MTAWSERQLGMHVQEGLAAPVDEEAGTCLAQVRRAVVCVGPGYCVRGIGTALRCER